ncbi:MAG TPA: hypothetical protein ENK57_08555 [Polyangiaceae bacterium]|nr:hypothetical protein [Polyangiaceae bacterium]
MNYDPKLMHGRALLVGALIVGSPAAAFAQPPAPAPAPSTEPAPAASDSPDGAEPPVPPAPGGAHQPALDPSDLPPGPLKRAILDFQKAVRASGQPESTVSKPIREALRAADRALGARAAGDTRHGGMLERLAKQWVATGEAILKAVASEASATAAIQRLQELTTKLERAEALLVEQQSRLGRLQAQIRTAEAEVAKNEEAAADAERKRIDRPKKRGAK